MIGQSAFLVLGATGGTGKHFVAQALKDGHRVRALIRNPAKLSEQPNLDIRHGSITEVADTDPLVEGIDFVVCMLGDVALQKNAMINTVFIKKLVPSMRRHGVKRILYQAGALSRPYQGHLTPSLWTIRHTLARSFAGQHEDNEAVMEYFATMASDIEWMVHRAGIGSDGVSKGVLERSATKYSIATHVDCAGYNYRTVLEMAAVHRCDFSAYAA